MAGAAVFCFIFFCWMMARPHSLRRQLWWSLVMLHLVATAVTALFSYLAYGRLIDTFMDEQMRLVAESHSGDRDPLALPPTAGEKAIQGGAFIVQLWSADGQALLANSWAPLTMALQPTPGVQDVNAASQVDDRWRVYTAPPGAHAGQPRVQVIQSAAFRRHRATRRALLESLPIVLLLPVSLLVLWLIVGAGSRSLRVVAHDIAAQDERSPDELPVTRVPEEIGPLVVAFNSVLARLRGALATQRRFVQDAAHELRTPITAIGLQIENLRALIPRGEASDRFEQLEAGVTRARHLTEQLLRLSRQDTPTAAVTASCARRDEGDRESGVNVAAVLRESVGQLIALADRRHVDIGFEGHGATEVDVPAAELRTVFDNLIDNAVRYSPEGGVVDVRLYALAGRPVVDVVDNGPGIPPELMSRVFDRFFRVPGSPVGGSGLGLAIAQGAGVRHGMQIELLNREGCKGLIARVHLVGPTALV
ncbi:ATP-binding protein [Variovorax sp. J22R133]|uniref:sensor histidine kinase n=1 Tax=Variovorax brevis TaxID=3053503 RepID=UPI002576B8E1|nr:ATP-binding protein [Variovorax sp. J22R133]MDM0116531.1 ATP-binding protein [Variovorax sp. J22R133]